MKDAVGRALAREDRGDNAWLRGKKQERLLPTRHGMSTRYVGCVGYVGMSDADAMLAMPAVGRTVRCPRHVDACV